MEIDTNRDGRDRPRRHIGLLGGSFNPAHEGHLHISRHALTLLALDEVWWLVSPQNPLKPETGMAPLDQRLAQAREIAGENMEIKISALEEDLGTRYTVDTVQALQKRNPDADFVLLVGADILEELPRWRQWERLFHILPIAVFARKPYSSRALSGLAAQRFAEFRMAESEAHRLAGSPPPAWVFLHIKEHPASATAIRAAHKTD
jgi:nicotinate-nucleotide adenylyltransferase